MRLFQRQASAVLLSVSLLAMTSCSRAQQAPSPRRYEVPAAAPTGTGTALAIEKLAATRRIIRNGNLSIGCADVAGAGRRASQVAEQRGGYVASSETTVDDDAPKGRTPHRTTVTLRIPAAAFDDVLVQLRALGSVLAETLTSQDVTDEYVDLEARARAQRALELTMLDLLKEAKTVKDALEVNIQLAAVRTEIEKLEGRQKLLDSQTSFSTIVLQIRPDVGTSDPWQVSRALAEAGSDVVKVSGGIVVYGIRLLGVLLPVVVLVGLPLYGLIRLLAAVRARRRKAVV